MDREHDGRNDERQRSDDPHERPCRDLILEGRQPEQAGRFGIGGIEHAIRARPFARLLPAGQSARTRRRKGFGEGLLAQTRIVSGVGSIP